MSKDTGTVSKKRSNLRERAAAVRRIQKLGASLSLGGLKIKELIYGRPTSEEFTRSHHPKQQDRRVMALRDFTDEDIALLKEARAPEAAAAFDGEVEEGE